MNEFTWRRQLRELRQPLSPPDDLWASIDRRLNQLTPLPVAPPAVQIEPRGTRRRRLLGVATLAASVWLCAGIGWRLLRPAAAPAPVVESAATPVSWRPADPRLAGASIELDAARMELRQALQQAPHSAALQRLLSRAERQQARLQRLGREAG